MAADRTLVDAAFTEAKSRYATEVPNLTNLYKSTVDISRGYMNVVSGAMNLYKEKRKTRQKALDLQMGQFNKIMEENLQALYNEQQPMPNVFINSVEGKLKELQDEFELVNTLGKGDTVENKRARRRITGDLNKVVAEIKQVRGTIQKMSVKAKDINKNRIGINTWAALSILDIYSWGTEKNPNIKLDWNEKGQVVFTTSGYNGYGTDNADGTGEPISLTMKELEEALPFANYDFDRIYVDELENTKNLGGRHGKTGVYDYKIDDQRAAFIDNLETDKDIENITGRKIQNVRGVSFEDALVENIDIPLALLDNMFVDDNDARVNLTEVFNAMDLKVDGVINEDDMILARAMGEETYASYEKNLDELIESIVNINHKAYNADRTKELLADYFIGRKGVGGLKDIKGFDWQSYDDAYDTSRRAQQKLNNPNDKDGKVFIKGLQYPYQEREVVNTTLDNFKDNLPVTDWAGTVWNPIGNGYYQSTMEKDKKSHASILMRSPYFKLGEYAAKHYPELYPLKNVVRDTPEVNFENTFTGPDQNVTATNFIKADPSEVAKILNNHYKNEAFGVSGKKVKIISGGKAYGFPISTKQEVQKLLDFLASVQSQWQNTDYQE